MAVHKIMVNAMKSFNAQAVRPIVINEQENTTEEQRLRNNSLIYTDYKSDVYNTTPSCLCGALTKERLLGIVCDVCKRPVEKKLETKLESQLWMQSPKGVSPFINPIAWILLEEFFSLDKGNFDVLLWLTTTDTHNKKYEAQQNEILSLGIERGYNYFAANFNAITKKLFALPMYNKPEKRAAQVRLIHVFNRYRDCIFTEFLPIINRNLMVMETEAVGRYIDKAAPMAVNAIRLMLGIDTKSSHLRQAARENRTAKMLSGICKFYREYFKLNFASKPGLIRKHMCSSRTAYAARAVITSITKPHRYDEVEFPWGPSIGMMRQMLINRLMRYGMSPNVTFAFLSQCIDNYHPLAGKILDDMIAETDEKKIPTTACRNPSLHRSSMQLLGISRFKKDPTDRTIGLPIPIVSGFNADFDGDEMGFVLPLDKFMTNLLEPLKPHKSCFDLSSYRGITGNISLSKPVVAAWSSALSSGARDIGSGDMSRYAHA